MFNKSVASIVIDLLLIFVMPSLIYVIFGLTSLAIGLVITSFFLIIKIYIGGISREFFKYNNVLLIYICTFIFLSFMYSFFVLTTQKSLTAFPLIFVIFAAITFSDVLVNAKIQVIVRGVYVFILILLSLGWLSFAYKVNIGNYKLHPMTIFPFSEYSHYSLALGVCVFSICDFLTRKKMLFVMTNCLMLSLMMPNMTLAIFFILTLLFISKRIKNKYRILAGFVLITVLLTYNALYGFEYFLGRIDLKSETNATALVWLQGFEFARDNLFKNFGFGIGFQTLGTNEKYYNETSDIIYSLSGSYLNVEDGGFLAAKLISEYGILGFVFVVSFIVYFIKLYVRPCGKLNSFESKNEIYYKIAFSIVIELLIRGYGFFSPGILFSISGFFAYLNNKKRNGVKFADL